MHFVLLGDNKDFMALTLFSMPPFHKLAIFCIMFLHEGRRRLKVSIHIKPSSLLLLFRLITLFIILWFLNNLVHSVYPVTPNAGVFYQRGFKQ